MEPEFTKTAVVCDDRFKGSFTVWDGSSIRKINCKDLWVISNTQGLSTTTEDPLPKEPSTTISTPRVAFILPNNSSKFVDAKKPIEGFQTPIKHKVSLAPNISTSFPGFKDQPVVNSDTITNTKSSVIAQADQSTEIIDKTASNIEIIPNIENVDINTSSSTSSSSSSSSDNVSFSTMSNNKLVDKRITVYWEQYKKWFLYDDEKNKPPIFEWLDRKAALKVGAEPAKFKFL